MFELQNQPNNKSLGWTEKYTTQVLQFFVLISGGWACVNEDIICIWWVVNMLSRSFSGHTSSQTKGLLCPHTWLSSYFWSNLLVLCSDRITPNTLSLLLEKGVENIFEVVPHLNLTDLCWATFFVSFIDLCVLLSPLSSQVFVNWFWYLIAGVPVYYSPLIWKTVWQ